MNQRIHEESDKIGNTDVKAVIEDGIWENPLKRSEHGISHLIQKPLETAFVVGSSQVKDDLQSDEPVAHTKKVVDKLTRPDNHNKAPRIILF